MSVPGLKKQKFNNRVELWGSTAQAFVERDNWARWQKEGILPYIFGYGSLIEQASRMRTTPAAASTIR